LEVQKKHRQFQPIKGLVGSFLIMIVIGTLLLWLPWASSDGKSLPLTDALFTSTSAVCVTGLIVRDTPAHFTPFGEIVILILFQAGGIGILTYTTLFAILMGRRIRYKSLNLFRDTFGSHPERSIISLLKWIILFTFSIELIGAILLLPSFLRDASWLKAVYLAVFHSVSAFCNAGFSLFSDSFISYRGDWLLNFVICSLIIIGGIGFPVIADIFENKRLTKLSHHSRLVIRISLWLIVIGWGLIYLFESRIDPGFWNMPAHERLFSSLFQSITARTAGFNTLDISAMTLPSLMIIICLMFIGGSPGGTAGGIKTTTFAVAAKSAFVFLTGKRTVDLGGRRVSQASQFRAGGLAFLAVILLVFATILITAFSNIALRDAAFEAASAFGTVGLSTGVTGSLGLGQKWIIILLMFIGRIGPVSLALSLGLREKSELATRPEVDVLTG
jgi:trk system potassium uptake protein TrkH